MDSIEADRAHPFVLQVTYAAELPGRALCGALDSGNMACRVAMPGNGVLL